MYLQWKSEAYSFIQIKIEIVWDRQKGPSLVLSAAVILFLYNASLIKSYFTKCFHL